MLYFFYQIVTGKDGIYMYRIGEFAKLCRTSGKTLRFYDAVGILKPDYTDVSTGYRFYAETKIKAFEKIRLLKEIGFTLREIKKSFLNSTDEQVLALLRLKEAKLFETVENCRRIRKQYEEVLKMAENNPRVIIKKMPELGKIAVCNGKIEIQIEQQSDAFVSMLDQLLNGDDIIENIDFNDLCELVKITDRISFQSFYLVDGVETAGEKDEKEETTIKKNTAGAVILVELPADKTLREVESAIKRVLKTLPSDCRIIWGAAVNQKLKDRFAVSVARFFRKAADSADKKAEDFVIGTPRRLQACGQNFIRKPSG